MHLLLDELSHFVQRTTTQRDHKAHIAGTHNWQLVFLAFAPCRLAGSYPLLST